MATTAKKPGSNGSGARKPAAKASTQRKTAVRGKDGTFRKSDNSHWGTAAIVGGVAAAGAIATAALFALRGSSALADMEQALLNRGDASGDHADEIEDTSGDTAHQADGTNSTASFRARIADEGTIPA